MTRRTKAVLLALLFGAVTLAGATQLSGRRPQSSFEYVPVVIGVVEKSMRLSAVVFAGRRVAVPVPLGVRILTVLAEAGATVSTGERLAIVDDTRLRVDYLRKEIALRKLRAAAGSDCEKCDPALHRQEIELATLETDEALNALRKSTPRASTNGRVLFAPSRNEMTSGLMFTIVADGESFLEVEADEHEAMLVRPGMQAKVWLGLETNDAVMGVVSSAPAMRRPRTAASINALYVFDVTLAKLSTPPLDGSTARVELDTGVSSKGITVPIESVVGFRDQQYVIFTSEGVEQVAAIQVIAANDKTATIEGLPGRVREVAVGQPERMLDAVRSHLAQEAQ